MKILPSIVTHFLAIFRKNFQRVLNVTKNDNFLMFAMKICTGRQNFR